MKTMNNFAENTFYELIWTLKITGINKYSLYFISWPLVYMNISCCTYWSACYSENKGLLRQNKCIWKKQKTEEWSERRGKSKPIGSCDKNQKKQDINLHQNIFKCLPDGEMVIYICSSKLHFISLHFFLSLGSNVHQKNCFSLSCHFLEGDFCGLHG